jgi:hypothetical protein
MELSNALKFEALMCAAYEMIRYAKPEFIAIGMDSFKSYPRKERRAMEKDFQSWFDNLHKMLYQFTDVVEKTNEEFFNRVVDALIETVSQDDVIGRG